MDSTTQSFQIDKVQNVLKSILDPEIGLNVVDLGLIYSINLDPGQKLRIDMTLTTSGCPMGEYILKDVQGKLEHEFPDYKPQINLVWEPKWNAEMISSDGLKFLGS